MRGTSRDFHLIRLQAKTEVNRSDCEFIVERMQSLDLPGRKPKRRCVDAVKEDMGFVHVGKEDAENEVMWRQRP